MTTPEFQIITFYEFKRLTELTSVRDRLIAAMESNSIRGTIIIAEEGFNSTVCGERANIEAFVAAANEILATTLRFKSSFHESCPFVKIHVKIKPEIVTLKKEVEISKGVGTHVAPGEWNSVISRDDVFLLDTRNDYEFRVGTFRGAVNPATEKFSDLPGYVAENLDPSKHKHVAMFCTGGIRCEKFAPYMKQIGFENIYQLEGGILKYLEDVPADESLWDGECYVFDRRVTVDENLQKGSAPDLSVDEGA